MMKLFSPIFALFFLFSLSATSADFNHLAMSEDFSLVASIAKSALIEHAKTYPTKIPFMGVKVTSISCADFNFEAPSIDISKWEKRMYKVHSETRFQSSEPDNVAMIMDEEVIIVLDKDKVLLDISIKSVSAQVGPSRDWEKFELVDIDFSRQAELHIQTLLADEDFKSKVAKPRIGVLFVSDHMFGQTTARLVACDGDDDFARSFDNWAKYVNLED